MENQRVFACVKAVLLVLLLGLTAGSLQAQVQCNGGLSCTQTINLNPGWNAVYLQVRPEQTATEQVLAELLDGSGPQLSSLWTWLPQRARIEFISDPSSDDMLSSPGWLRYFPQASEHAFLNNLYSLQVNRAYLLKLDGDNSTTLTISGRPLPPRTEWTPDSFTLTGFHINPASPPTFADYFAGSGAHRGQAVYRLDGDSWQAINPLSTVIDTNVAYWIYTQGGSDYAGPMAIDLPQLDGLEFSHVLDQLVPRLQNRLAVPQSISVRVIGAAPGLHYGNPDPAAQERWLAFSQSVNTVVPAAGEYRMPIGIKRADFHPGSYGQILEISSAAGSRWLIPVSASAPPLNSLWVGTVSIDHVSQAHDYRHDCDSNGANPGNGHRLCLDADEFPIELSHEVMTPVASPFDFRIILHRDGAQVRLLKDVIQMWQDGANGQPGRYVLLTDDILIANYQGVALRDGEVVGRRLSSVAYDFPGNSLDMAGSLGATLSASINLAANAPSNPFKHYYHPDHNGLAADYITPNNEVYAVTRTLEFSFDNTETSALGSGYDVSSGSYREVVTGLHKYPIIASGRFSLRHAASVPTLNQ